MRKLTSLAVAAALLGPASALAHDKLIDLECESVVRAHDAALEEIWHLMLDGKPAQTRATDDTVFAAPLDALQDVRVSMWDNNLYAYKQLVAEMKSRGKRLGCNWRA